MTLSYSLPHVCSSFGTILTGAPACSGAGFGGAALGQVLVLVVVVVPLLVVVMVGWLFQINLLQMEMFVG
jgi:hypothetical protein